MATARGKETCRIILTADEPAADRMRVRSLVAARVAADDPAAETILDVRIAETTCWVLEAARDAFTKRTIADTCGLAAARSTNFARIADSVAEELPAADLINEICLTT